MGILFQDLDFAEQNHVETALWTSHILINNIYRQVSKTLPQDMRAKIRSVESQYNRFITTSQLFYKGYIQRLSQRYNIPSLHRIASAVDVEHGPQQDTINSMSPGTRAKVLRSVQDTLTYLGDLARYRSQLRSNNRDNQSAMTFYSLAHDVAPDRGSALHQIGVTYLESNKHLDVVYYFFLSLARTTPHPNAQKNLEAKLKAAQTNRAMATSSQGTQPILEGRVVQLFANYMVNPSFAGRDELEKTVLARLEQLLQAPHSVEVVVKIALSSMGAYYYARSQGNPTLPPSLPGAIFFNTEVQRNRSGCCTRLRSPYSLFRPFAALFVAGCKKHKASCLVNRSLRSRVRRQSGTSPQGWTLLFVYFAFSRVGSRPTQMIWRRHRPLSKGSSKTLGRNLRKRPAI